MAESKNFNLSPAPSGKARDLKRQVLPPVYEQLTSQDVSSLAKEESSLSDEDYLQRLDIESLGYPV